MSVEFELRIHRLDKENSVAQAAKVRIVSDRGESLLLPGHEDFITSLVPGKLMYETIDHMQHDVMLENGGFLKFSGDQCDVWMA